MLYDHDNGRRSEVEEINGLVVEGGSEFGIPTPVNARVVEITRRIHAGDIKPDTANLADLLASLTD